MSICSLFSGEECLVGVRHPIPARLQFEADHRAIFAAGRRPRRRRPAASIRGRVRHLKSTFGLGLCLPRRPSSHGSIRVSGTEAICPTSDVAGVTARAITPASPSMISDPLADLQSHGTTVRCFWGVGCSVSRRRQLAQPPCTLMPLTHPRIETPPATAGSSAGREPLAVPALPQRHFRVDAGHPLGHAATATSVGEASAVEASAGPSGGARAADEGAFAANPLSTNGTEAYAGLVPLEEIGELARAAAGSPPVADVSREERWLRLHAAELIDRLQSWSVDLDSREAQLNARAALLDHRERQLRLQRQSAESDLTELKRSIESEYEQLRACARRLAFE